MAAELSGTDGPIRSDIRDHQGMAVFERDIGSVSAARDWLSEFLRQHHLPAAVSRDAVLIISELVTNALRHGLGQVVTRTTLDHGDRLYITVTDSGNELPEVLPVDHERAGGVGLHIVERLATEWGVAPFPGGKTVWAMLFIDRAA